MPSRPLPVIVPGRGSATNRSGRFEPLQVEPDGPCGEEGSPRTLFLKDHSKGIIATNRSPDVGLDAGINPYRGCEHGCAYCYARPTHEYLGFSAGLDFETRIVVKEDAADLLRAALSSPRWRPRPLMLSGNTDPYQPGERRLGITRACLAVLAEHRNPVGIITKSDGVLRDLDLLAELARHDAVAVTLSITSLQRDLQKRLEPRASTPKGRLRAIRALSEAGIPVGVNLAPVIPGLTDEEMPSILEAAAEAGARWSGYILLRLPHGVKELFTEWLDAHEPGRKEKVLARLREAYGGALYDARYGVRGKGSGPYATQLRQLHRVSAARLGLGRPPELSTKAFRRPGHPPGQAPGDQLDLGLATPSPDADPGALRDSARRCRGSS